MGLYNLRRLYFREKDWVPVEEPEREVDASEELEALLPRLLPQVALGCRPLVEGEPVTEHRLHPRHDDHHNRVYNTGIYSLSLYGYRRYDAITLLDFSQNSTKYRPQTKFGARLYFHRRVSRILFTGGEGLPQCILGYHPPGPDTPRAPPLEPGTHPRDRTPPRAEHAGRYGQ